MQILSIDTNILTAFKGLYDPSIADDLGEDALIVGAFDDSVKPYKTAGVLIAGVIGYSLMIEWIYVAPEYRRRGIGTKLVDKIMSLADKAGMKNAMATISSANEGMTEFMKHGDFMLTHYSGWHEYNCRLNQFRPVKSSELDKSFDLASIYTLSSEVLASFSEFLEGSEINVGVPLPINAGSYSPFSLCVRKNGHITGIILVNTPALNDSGRIEMPWVYFSKEGTAAMPNLYDSLISVLKKQYPGDCPVHFEALNETMDTIISKILPDAGFEEIYLASWVFG